MCFDVLCTNAVRNCRLMLSVLSAVSIKIVPFIDMKTLTFTAKKTMYHLCH